MIIWVAVVYSFMRKELVGIARTLLWNVCCVFDGVLAVIVRHADHRDTLHNGDPGTRIPGYSFGTGTWVLGYPATRPQTPGVFWVGHGPRKGRTRPGKPAGYPGPTRTSGTRTTDYNTYSTIWSCLRLPMYAQGASHTPRVYSSAWLGDDFDVLWPKEYSLRSF